MNKLLEKLPFKNANWFKFLVFLIKRFLKDDCLDKASALTYTTLLSIVPILTVFLVILSSIPALATVRSQIQEAIYSNFLPQTGSQVTKYLNEFTEKSSNLTIVGVIFLFVSAILMLSAIEKAFNHVWRVTRSREGALAFARYWAIISLGPILLGGAFLASTALTSLSVLNINVNGYSIDWTFWLRVAAIVLTLVGFTFIYWLIPNCKVPFKQAAIAGVISGLLFTALKAVFGFGISNFTSYDKVYGAFAALPIFLVWIYSSWVVILLGVEISYALTVFQSAEHRPLHPVLAILDILKMLHTNQKVGDEIIDTQVMKALGRDQVDNWNEYAEVLHAHDIIKRTEKGGFILSRSLEDLDFWTFYKDLPYPLPRREDLGKVHADDEWAQVIGPLLIQSEDYLAAKLSLPLARVFTDAEAKPVKANALNKLMNK